MSEKYCERHSDRARHDGDRNRKPLDPIMADLPKSQAGKGKHRCVYCAYERGYKDAKREMQAALENYKDAKREMQAALEKLSPPPVSAG